MLFVILNIILFGFMASMLAGIITISVHSMPPQKVTNADTTVIFAMLVAFGFAAAVEIELLLYQFSKVM